MVISTKELKSTREAAHALGIHHITLQRYVSAKRGPAPSIQKVGGVRVRLWSEEDIKKVRDILPKLANGRKTKIRKKLKKRATGSE